MDEDPLQRWICFLAFVASLVMIFHSTQKLVKYFYIIQKKGGEDIKYFEKNAIRNLLHTNIGVHSRRVITELPADGIKCIEKLHSHCANMTVADKSRYNMIFQKVTHKGGNLQ